MITWSIIAALHGLSSPWQSDSRPPVYISSPMSLERLMIDDDDFGHHYYNNADYHDYDEMRMMIMLSSLITCPPFPQREACHQH